MFPQLYKIKLGIIKESVEDISLGNEHILSSIYTIPFLDEFRYMQTIYLERIKKNRMPGVQAN